MNIENILNSKLMRKSSINTKEYQDYIRKTYFNEDCDITKLYPELVFIDSNNIETFWINNSNDGTIVLDLHMVDLIHFFSIISELMSKNYFEIENTILISSYILSNICLVKGELNSSLHYLNLYIHLVNNQHNLFDSMLSNTSNINYEVQLMRGVQIHYFLLHEMGHIEFRTKKANIMLYDLIIKEIAIFNNYVNAVNNYDITSIEEILLKNRHESPSIYFRNVMKECEQLYNSLTENEQHIFKSVIENYYTNSLMDNIDPQKDVDIIEECYCDLYATKIIFENYYFTSRCLSIDNYKLIINSIICAFTCIDLIDTTREISHSNILKKDKILLRKEIYRPILYKLLNFYYFNGIIKRDASTYRKYFREHSQYNEMIYRFCIEFIVFNRENKIINNDVLLFGNEWYKLRDYININLKLPFCH